MDIDPDPDSDFDPEKSKSQQTGRMHWTLILRASDPLFYQDPNG
jgi:hypothetical protein